jgi:L-threonylcarbamoyladenylate synthase
VKVFRTETLEDSGYEEIVSLLRSGGVIAFPTDTAYGLGADPFSDAAINRIFAAKGRSEDKPILLLVDSVAMAESVATPSAAFYKLVEQFWPGPLTMILPAAKSVPLKLTAGKRTVGVRWPMAGFAVNLMRHLGGPITATSANQSGRPAAVTAEEVRAQLDERIDALIDGGPLPFGGGSTVIDLTIDPPALLREGPISFATLQTWFHGRMRRQA